MTTGKQNLMRVFGVGFAAMCGMVLFSALLYNVSFAYNIPLALAAAAVYGALYYGVWRGLGWAEKRLQAHPWRILATALLAIGALYGLMAKPLATYFIADMGDVFRGAVVWTVEGNALNFQVYQEYLLACPNNIGLFTLLQGAFRMAYRLGSTDFYAVGVALNILSLLLCVLFLYLYLRKAYGVRVAAMGLCLYAGCLPLHFYSGYFYTDTMSIAVIPAVLYLDACAQSAKSRKARMLLWGVMGLCAALGYQLRPTALIVAIAICLQTLYCVGWRSALGKIIAFALGMAVCSIAFNFYVYQVAGFVDKNMADAWKTTPLAWVVMGTKDAGGYDRSVLEEIRNLPLAQRSGAALERIGTQVRTLAEEKNLTKFFVQKTAKTFGVGTLQVSSHICANPPYRSWLQEFAYADGKYYGVFAVLCQGWWLMLWGMMAAAGVQLAWRHTALTAIRFLPMLTLFGVFLFYGLWEAMGRYPTSFVPVLLFIACGALSPQKAKAAEEEHKMENFDSCTVS